MRQYYARHISHYFSLLNFILAASLQRPQPPVYEGLKTSVRNVRYRVKFDANRMLNAPCPNLLAHRKSLWRAKEIYKRNICVYGESSASCLSMQKVMRHAAGKLNYLATRHRRLAALRCSTVYR